MLGYIFFSYLQKLLGYSINCQQQTCLPLVFAALRLKVLLTAKQLVLPKENFVCNGIYHLWRNHQKGRLWYEFKMLTFE